MKGIAKEHCCLKFECQEVNTEDGTFRGVGSAFGSRVDAWIPTVIEKGAFAKTLSERTRRVKLLFDHDTSKPIGVPVTLMESDRGLEVHGKISQTTLGKDTLILMRDGILDLSVGFDPIKIEMEKLEDGTDLRHIKELRLWDISAVTFPADPNAKITSVHSLLEDLPKELRAIIEPLASIEILEGKVLSAKNAELVRGAIAALDALLTAAEPPQSQGDNEQALTARMEQLRNAELEFAQMMLR